MWLLTNVFEYDVDSTSEELDEWCKECDFVFNLAGVNRPQNQEEFMEGISVLLPRCLILSKSMGTRVR